MIDQDIDPQLEARIRRTLSVIATTTPIDDLELTVRRADASRLRLVTIAAALIVVVGVGGLYVIATRLAAVEPAAVTSPAVRLPTTTSPPPIVPPAPVAHQGEEYPIERMKPGAIPKLGGLLSLGVDTIVEASSTRFWKTADAEFFAFRTIGIEGDNVVDYRCAGELSDGGGWGGGCSSAASLAYQPAVGGSWSELDGQPGSGSGMWSWSSVPGDTDFVQYRSRNLVFWQHPVDGFAAFPATSADSAADVSAIAYRSDGAVLAVVDAAATYAGAVAEQLALGATRQSSHLPEALVSPAQSLAVTSFSDCLTASGATLEPSDDVGTVKIATIGVGSDVDTVWVGCISVAQTALADYVAAHTPAS